MNRKTDNVGHVFLTVGAQMPYDRLVCAVDRWAEFVAGVAVFAQIGDTLMNPNNLEHTKFLTPNEFRERVVWADLMVSHAGMGSIITALEYGKPIIVMPRLASLRETRNDHQVATASRLRAMAKIVVADNVNELTTLLGKWQMIAAGRAIGNCASPELVATIREFIDGS